MPAPPTEPEPEPPKRRRGVIAAAIAVVLIIVAGLAAFAITRSDTAEAQPLALSFTQGEEKTPRRPPDDGREDLLAAVRRGAPVD